MRTIRNFLLGGAVLFLASTVQAGQSSPAEREQTRQLNLAASQQAQATAGETHAVPSGEAMAPIALNSLSSPPDSIATAKVVDEKGRIVGAVQKVDLDQSGKPTQVEIALLGSDQIITLQSSRLSYDAVNNILTASLDNNQIGQLPSAG